MGLQDHFIFPADLTEAESAAVVTSAKYLLMRFTRHLIIGGLDEAQADIISQEALRRLEGTFGAERARLIVRCANRSLMASWLSSNEERFAAGEALGGRMLACAYYAAEESVPTELQGVLVDFAALAGDMQLMRKGRASEHMKGSLGFDLGDQTPRLARVYYGLRKELESPEEKRGRRSGAGKAGALLEEVVACELNTSVGTLRDWLKKADGF